MDEVNKPIAIVKVTCNSTLAPQLFKMIIDGVTKYGLKIGEDLVGEFDNTGFKLSLFTEKAYEEFKGLEKQTIKAKLLEKMSGVRYQIFKM